MKGLARLDGHKRRRGHSQKGSESEGNQRHPDHRSGQVDEPVRQKWSDAQEDDVVEQIVLLMLDDGGPVGGALRKVLQDDGASGELGEEEAEGGADRRTGAD